MYNLQNPNVSNIKLEIDTYFMPPPPPLFITYGGVWA